MVFLTLARRQEPFFAPRTISTTDMPWEAMATPLTTSASVPVGNIRFSSVYSWLVTSTARFCFVGWGRTPT